MSSGAATSKGWRPDWRRRTWLMGVINVTPDSFSHDGIYRSPVSVAAWAEQLVEDGADILDIGGESTRPGYEPVPVDEEIERVVPALVAIKQRVPVPISVDTSKAEVARVALAEGASLINDVSGLRDTAMAHVVASAGAGLVVVHSTSVAHGGDLVDGIRAELERTVERAISAGVQRERIIVDPGLGMSPDRSKLWRQNFEIIRRLFELRQLGIPILVGPSRKRMIEVVLGVEVADRLEGTAALTTLCIASGADAVRVHDVREMARVARMTDALVS